MGPSLKRRLLIGGAVLALLVFGAGALFAANTWGEVNRVTIERPERQEPDPVEESEPNPEPVDSVEDEEEEIEPVEVTGRRIFLLAGSDSRADLEDLDGFGDFEGNRADVIMVLIKDGSDTALLSLPRDLLVENPCGGRDDRINAMLQGCATMNGATLLTLAVEETIGQTVDHFALIDFVGFQEIVDAVGGYEICVDNPVRDERARLELPGGCTNADGEQTLAWMRSRRTQELTESGWRTLPGMSDLARNERQRQFLIDIMGRLSDISSPQAMASSAQAVAPYVTVDSELTLIDAVNLAWTMRGLDSGRVVELEVPVYGSVTDAGASVLLPSRPVDDIVAEFLIGLSN